MARRIPVTSNETETLATLIPQYYTENTLANETKKKADELNKKIKKLFVEDDSTLVNSKDAKKDERRFVSNSIEATYYLQERTSLNEEKVVVDEGLIAFLKKNKYTKAIKTIEIVDTDALEQMAYDGTITKKHLGEMKKFEKTKDVAYLTVKAIKEG